MGCASVVCVDYMPPRSSALRTVLTYMTLCLEMVHTLSQTMHSGVVSIPTDSSRGRAVGFSASVEVAVLQEIWIVMGMPSIQNAVT